MAGLIFYTSIIPKTVINQNNKKDLNVSIKGIYLNHRNIKIQGITTVISLLYCVRWNYYFVSLCMSTYLKLSHELFAT